MNSGHYDDEAIWSFSFVLMPPQTVEISKLRAPDLHGHHFSSHRSKIFLIQGEATPPL